MRLWKLLLLYCVLNKHLRLLTANNLVLLDVLLSQLLSLGHLPARFSPLLLTQSHLLLLLGSVYLSIGIFEHLILILVRIHVIDVYILTLLSSCFVINMGIAWDSLDLFNDELLRLSLVKVSTRGFQRLDLFNGFELIRFTCEGTFELILGFVLYLQFVLPVTRKVSIWGELILDNMSSVRTAISSIDISLY